MDTPFYFLRLMNRLGRALPYQEEAEMVVVDVVVEFYNVDRYSPQFSDFTLKRYWERIWYDALPLNDERCKQNHANMQLTLL